MSSLQQHQLKLYDLFVRETSSRWIIGCRRVRRAVMINNNNNHNNNMMVIRGHNIMCTLKHRHSRRSRSSRRRCGSNAFRQLMSRKRFVHILLFLCVLARELFVRRID